MSIEISVIICTHNRAKYLPKAIQSLLDQPFLPDRYEIIVVDNCSTDSTKTIVEQYAAQEQYAAHTIRYVYEQTLGLSYARNTGWQKAQGSYVAYLDDDAIAFSNWLSTISEVFTSITPQPGCVGGRAEAIWEADRPSWLADELVPGLTVIDWSKTPFAIPDLAHHWLVGANIAFPKKVLEQTGGFINGLDRAGKNLLSGGDIFLEKQILKAGYSCFYHPDMAIGHHIQKTRLEQQWFIRRYYWQGISDAVAHMLEESPSLKQRTHSILSRTVTLMKSPRKITRLLLPQNDPQEFKEKCFTLIELGHIVGLVLQPQGQ
jgi:glycosyltransferase involved in cell wall biosynthesis